MKSSIATMGALAALSLGAASPAHAYLRVCNDGGKVISYSHVYSDPSCRNCNGDVCASNPKPWREAGWWVLSPGECKRVFEGDARRTFYYVAYTIDGASQFPGPLSSQNRWLVPFEAHNQCQTDALLRGDDPGLHEFPHNRFDGKDTDALIRLAI
ncbi:MAG: DUF1036 domain-containing protein [Polyangiales bacterium]